MPERQSESASVFDAAVAHICALQTSGHHVILGVWSDGSRDRLCGVLSDHGSKKPVAITRLTDIYALKRGTDAAVWGLEAGFVAGELAVVSEGDIGAARARRHLGAKRPADRRRPGGARTPVSKRCPTSGRPCSTRSRCRSGLPIRAPAGRSGGSGAAKPRRLRPSPTRVRTGTRQAPVPMPAQRLAMGAQGPMALTRSADAEPSSRYPAAGRVHRSASAAAPAQPLCRAGAGFLDVQAQN